MTVVFPDGVFTAGRERVQFVPAVADMNNPTVEECTASGAVDISCYLIKGEWNLTGEQATGTDERICSEQAGTVLGPTTYSMEQAQYVYDPQAEDAAEDNLAYDALKPGTKGFVVDRRGLKSGEDFAADQKVDVYQVECGAQIRMPVSTDAGDKFKVQQTLSVNPNAVFDAKVTASAGG